MSNTQQIFQPPSGCDLTRIDARESGVVRSVVRNVVVNMESVLHDLHGIMGEITSIVEQIDTVTDKMGKNCREKKDATYQTSVNYSLPNSKWGNSLKYEYKTDISNNLYNTQTDTLRSLAQNYQTQSSHSLHNVLKVNGFSRTQKLHPNEDSSMKFLNQEEPTSKDWQNETFSCFTKSFSHLPKDGCRSISQAGAIAIVYPTVINNVSVEPNNQATKPSLSDQYQSHELLSKEECFENAIFPKCANNNNNNIVNHSKIIHPPISAFEKESKKHKLWKTKQLKETPPVYNNCFKTVTPSKRQSIFNETNNEFAPSKLSRGLHKDTSKAERNDGNPTLNIPVELDMPIGVESTNIQSLTENGAKIFKDSFLEFSKVRPQIKHLPLNDINVVSNSAHLKHSFLKSTYIRAQISPMSQGSLDSTLKCEFPNSFDSVDNDFNAETPENRCATPVIDYSYLNLVGNNLVLNKPTESLHPDGSMHSVYNLPVDHVHKLENRLIKKMESDRTSPRIIAQPMGSAGLMFRKIQNSHTDSVWNSPVWTHLFCSEVTYCGPDDYCGCYEAVLDSVLENIPGYESFEEACEDFDYTVALNKAYVIFENEYEEDDWGIGLKFSGQHGCEISSIDTRDVHGQNCGALKMPDNNDNQTSDNVQGFQQKQENLLARSDSSGAAGDTDNVAQHGHNEKVMSSTETLRVVTENMKMSGQLGASLSRENFETIKPRFSNQQKSLNLRPNTFNLSDINYRRERLRCLDQMDFKSNITDVTSCLTVESGSPMSMSSLDSSFVMSETGSLFEGDDLLTSPNDSHSICSETSSRASTSIHRAKMKKLRREFFKSMYSAGETKETEREMDKVDRPVSGQSICLENTTLGGDSSRYNISESDSYQETITSYNKNINPWTAYALVHQHADDMSDSSSDIFSDNTISCRITTSTEADNHDDALEAHV